MTGCVAVVRYDGHWESYRRTFKMIADGQLVICKSTSIIEAGYNYTPYIPVCVTPTIFFDPKYVLLRAPGVRQPKNGVFCLKLADDQMIFDLPGKNGFVQVPSDPYYAIFDPVANEIKISNLRRRSLYKVVSFPGCFVLVEDQTSLKVAKNRRRKKHRKTTNSFVTKLTFQNPGDDGPVHRPSGIRYRASYAEREPVTFLEMVRFTSEEELP